MHFARAAAPRGVGPPPRAVVLHVVDDVGSLASSGRSSQLETEVLERMVGALSELRVPVVGSTRGEVEGAALAALAADYRVGGQSAALGCGLARASRCQAHALPMGLWVRSASAS